MLEPQVCPWCTDSGCLGECSPGRVAEPIVDATEVTRQTVCMDCDRPFELGERYASRLTGFVGDVPVTETICVPCGMRGAVEVGG
jgi:hypothetical protein